MNNNRSGAMISLIGAMFIFGTVGIFRTNISLSSSIIAFVRGTIGMLFLMIVMLFKRQAPNWQTIKKNLLLLCISGAFIGVNWILLFESYRYTSVSTATLCYYMAPIFVIILSPFLLKEKSTPLKWICAGVALIGMTVISGIFTDSIGDPRGILFGIGAAVLYAAVIILNKFIRDISNYEKTLIQLGMAALAILPYVLLTENVSDIVSVDLTSLILLLVVGIVHTGISYTLYFGSIEKLEAHTTAILGYIDPVVALILSALLLNESFTFAKAIGSILILGSAFLSEMPRKEKNKQ